MLLPITAKRMEGRMVPTVERKREIIDALTELTKEANSRFSILSSDQLNWKPDKKNWSIGQCFDHMITMNELYFPQLHQIGRREKRPTLWERTSPFSRFLGKQLVQSMRPENLKKTKTSGKAEPTVSNVDTRIIDQFSDCQAQLIEHIQHLPDDLDVRQTFITSPLISLVTYSLDDGLTLLVLHEQRHFGQAQRVMEASGFPD